MVVNAAARLVVGLAKCEHITPVLRDALHWLPVPVRIQFSATLTFDCVRGTGPAYSSSTALPAQSLTIQAILVSARPSVAICSFHKLEQLARKAELLHHNSSCLELTAASPSLPVHQSQSVSSRAEDLSYQAVLSLTFNLRTIEEI